MTVELIVVIIHVIKRIVILYYFKIYFYFPLPVRACRKYQPSSRPKKRKKRVDDVTPRWLRHSILLATCVSLNRWVSIRDKANEQEKKREGATDAQQTSLLTSSTLCGFLPQYTTMPRNDADDGNRTLAYYHDHHWLYIQWDCQIWTWHFFSSPHSTSFLTTQLSLIASLKFTKALLMATLI